MLFNKKISLQQNSMSIYDETIFIQLSSFIKLLYCFLDFEKKNNFLKSNIFQEVPKLFLGISTFVFRVWGNCDSFTTCMDLCLYSEQILKNVVISYLESEKLKRILD